MKSEKQTIRDMMKEDLTIQGEMILNQLSSIEKQAKEAMEAVDITGIETIYVTGCGDSFYAGNAARYFFEKYANVFFEAVEAFEFTQYACRKLRPNALILAISISGQVGTTLRTIEVCKEKGIPAIGINATPNSRIYKVADRVIDIGVRVREPSPVPQTYHYLGNLTALYVLAITFGVKRGYIDYATYDKVMEEIRYNLSHVRTDAEVLMPQIFSFSKEQLHGKEFVIVGSGPNLATACFGVAKLNEAACRGSISQQTEEWAHEQFFITGENTVTFVLAIAGEGFERSCQILSSVLSLGGLAVAITNRPGAMPHGCIVFPLTMAENELLSPMNAKHPLEMFAYSIAEHLDIRPFNYDNPIRKKVCEQSIYVGGKSAEEVARERERLGKN